MLKAARSPRFLFILIGVLFIPVVLTNAVGTILSLASPTAHAADGRSDHSEVACTSSNHAPSFGGTVIIDANEVLCSQLLAFGGTIAVKGEVRGNIIAFNSAITIDGGVIGNIDLFGGTISLHAGSRVQGDINLYGSKVYGDNKGQIVGAFNDHSNPGWLFGLQAFHFPFWFLFFMIPLGVLCIRLLPEHVMFVRATMKYKMRRSLVVGLLTCVLAPAVLIVLIALIVSIPLALIVLLGLLAAWILGSVAIGWMIGEQIVQALTTRQPTRNTRYLQVIVGLIALALLSSLPIIGWLISIGTGLLGLGAVLLSRFGTRLYSQPKQPLPF